MKDSKEQRYFFVNQYLMSLIVAVDASDINAAKQKLKQCKYRDVYEDYTCGAISKQWGLLNGRDSDGFLPMAEYQAKSLLGALKTADAEPEETELSIKILELILALMRNGATSEQSQTTMNEICELLGFEDSLNLEDYFGCVSSASNMG